MSGIINDFYKEIEKIAVAGRKNTSFELEHEYLLGIWRAKSIMIELIKKRVKKK